VVISLIILIKAEFSKAFMNLGVVHDQKKHNSEKNQKKYLGKELYEYYCIGYTKG